MREMRWVLVAIALVLVVSAWSCEGYTPAPSPVGIPGTRPAPDTDPPPKPDTPPAQQHPYEQAPVYRGPIPLAQPQPEVPQPVNPWNRPPPPEEYKNPTTTTTGVYRGPIGNYEPQPGDPPYELPKQMTT